MNNKIKTYLHKRKAMIISTFCVLLLIMIACEVSFHNLKIVDQNGKETTKVNAGDTVTFYYDMYINSIYDYTNEKLVVAILAPKSWNVKNNARLTLLAPSSKLGNELQDFEPIPLGTYPAKMPGVDWTEALKIFIEDDPNIEDADMEWIAFITKNGSYISSSTDWKDVKLTIKIKTGPGNVKCKLGFFAACNSEALGEDFNKSLTSFNGWTYTNCFEVTNGEGDLVDYCVLHYNSAIPGNSTQNDLLTFRFNSGIDENPEAFLNELAFENEIYYNATAYTKAGKKYSKKVKMGRNSEFGRTFTLTIWPENFFGIDRSETLDKIEYYFSNEDGSKFVDYQDDKIQSSLTTDAPGEIKLRRDRPVEPFNYNFYCR